LKVHVIPNISKLVATPHPKKGGSEFIPIVTRTKVSPLLPHCHLGEWNLDCKKHCY